MNPADRINISGIIFHIGTESIHIIQNELNSLRSKVALRENHAGVASEAENLLAEMLLEEVTQSKTPLSKEKIVAVLNRLNTYFKQ
jgi:hypothetical protein